mmetsp:Transcript_745/g.931  ORF Transcript_745/g.931 Transcript_745/m.931 type:complete len:167 (-) Transcript_745:145-645(-)|eukprot:jgi/Bigna1/134330/aug1.24_g9038
MSGEEDYSWEEVSAAKSAQSSGGANSTYISVAFLLSVLPVFLFYTVYKLHDILVVYVVVTAISTVLLSTAYQKVMTREKYRLMGYRREAVKNHRKYGLTQAEFEKEQNTLTSNEALYFSLFRNNLTYVIFFLFFAFYAFRDINRDFCYAISVGLSSVLVWKFSDWV